VTPTISRFINPYQRPNPTSSPDSAVSLDSLFNVSASKQEGQNSDAHTLYRRSNLHSAKIVTWLYHELMASKKVLAVPGKLNSS
jgi:hypothetical protein